ncbi:MAG: J domain-containing protein, partial [Polyangiales bacterium]
MPLPRIPTPVSGLDVRRLPLNTTEGFVLSRVDGSASVEDISMMSGIDAQRVLGILDRLAELGAVGLPWANSRPKPAPARREGGTLTGEKSPPPARPPDAHFVPKRTRYASSELDEKVDIPVDTRRRILNAFYALEGLDLYAVLGVERKADKRAIRNAYFELSKLFHPDAHFGKQLGGFK